MNNKEERRGILVPAWAVPAIIALISAFFGYAISSARSGENYDMRLTQAEHRMDRMETAIEQVTSSMNAQVVKLTEVAVELKNLNQNLTEARK